MWLLDVLLGLVGLDASVALLDPRPRRALGLRDLGALAGRCAGSPSRFLWRIRTKLILSYLFVALVPVVLLSLFLAIASILFIGLVASRLVTGDIERAGEVLRTTARSAIADLPADDTRAAEAPARTTRPARRRCTPDLAWTLLRDGRVVAASGDAPRELPDWWEGPGFSGMVPSGDAGASPSRERSSAGSGRRAGSPSSSTSPPTSTSSPVSRSAPAPTPFSPAAGSPAEPTRRPEAAGGR